MTATCKLSRSPAQPALSIVASVVSVAVTGVKKVSRALKNRRKAVMLAGMDDRMLADIGLTRSDLRDAYAEPLWRDPTDVLAGRAREKRMHSHTNLTGRRVSAPPLTPDKAFVAPPTSRSSRLIV